MVHPNPSTGVFRVLFASESTILPTTEVVDVLGRKIAYRTEVIASNELLLDLSGNATGVYYLRFKQDGRIQVVELMVN
jgi:hypothetical protein